MIKEAIIKLVGKGDLTYEEARTVMLEIMGGKTTPNTERRVFGSSFYKEHESKRPLMKFSGCAEAMRSLATPVPHPGMEVLEIVGTGGDGAPFLQYFNDVSHGSCCRRRESSKTRQSGCFFAVRHSRLP